MFPTIHSSDVGLLYDGKVLGMFKIEYSSPHEDQRHAIEIPIDQWLVASSLYELPKNKSVQEVTATGNWVLVKYNNNTWDAFSKMMRQPAKQGSEYFVKPTVSGKGNVCVYEQYLAAFDDRKLYEVRMPSPSLQSGQMPHDYNYIDVSPQSKALIKTENGTEVVDFFTNRSEYYLDLNTNKQHKIKNLSHLVPVYHDLINIVADEKSAYVWHDRLTRKRKGIRPFLKLDTSNLDGTIKQIVVVGASRNKFAILLLTDNGSVYGAGANISSILNPIKDKVQPISSNSPESLRFHKFPDLPKITRLFQSMGPAGIWFSDENGDLLFLGANGPDTLTAGIPKKSTINVPTAVPNMKNISAIVRGGSTFTLFVDDASLFFVASHQHKYILPKPIVPTKLMKELCVETNQPFVSVLERVLRSLCGS